MPFQKAPPGCAVVISKMAFTKLNESFRVRPSLHATRGRSCNLRVQRRRQGIVNKLIFQRNTNFYLNFFSVELLFTVD